jgi:hypothetical protein
MAVLVPDVERHARRRDLAALLVGAAALIFAVAVALYLLWRILASTTATPFDADGVRCYHRGEAISCLKTAEPPR